MKKIKIVGELRSNILDSLCGPIEDAIEFLQAEEERYKDSGYLSISIELDGDWDNTWLSIQGERYETDKEYASRIKKVKQIKKKKEAEERKKYFKMKKEIEKLDRRYGGKISS